MAWDAASQSHLLARTGTMPRYLLYVYALETDHTDAPLGLWTGEFDATFTIDGTSRVYMAGADGMIPDRIVYEKGTTIRRQNVALNGVNADAQELVRGRIIRGRRAELHLALFDPSSETMIGYDRLFKGFINRSPINIGAFGKTSGIQIELISSMKTLSKTASHRKADSSQQARNADRFYRYGSVATQVQTEWSRD